MDEPAAAVVFFAAVVAGFFAAVGVFFAAVAGFFAAVVVFFAVAVVFFAAVAAFAAVAVFFAADERDPEAYLKLLGSISSRLKEDNVIANIHAAGDDRAKIFDILAAD